MLKRSAVFYVKRTCFVILCSLYCHIVYAAAWLQPESIFQLITGTSYYRTNKFFDKSGNKQPTDLFQKIDTTPLIEYGYSKNTTLGMSTSLQHIVSYDNTSMSQRSRLAYGEFFYRQKIYERKNTFFSYQPLIKIPGLYTTADEKFFGNRGVDLELRTLTGYAFQWPGFKDNQQRPYAGQYHFLNNEVALRYYTDGDVLEMRQDATLGIRPFPSLLLLGQSFLRKNFGKKEIDVNTLQTNNDALTVVKLQGSVVQQITDKASLQFGVFKDVYGTNASQGTGAFMNVWLNF